MQFCCFKKEKTNKALSFSTATELIFPVVHSQWCMQDELRRECMPGEFVKQGLENEHYALAISQLLIYSPFNFVAVCYILVSYNIHCRRNISCITYPGANSSVCAASLYSMHRHISVSRSIITIGCCARFENTKNERGRIRETQSTFYAVRSKDNTVLIERCHYYCVELAWDFPIANCCCG